MTSIFNATINAILNLCYFQLTLLIITSELSAQREKQCGIYMNMEIIMFPRINYLLIIYYRLSWMDLFAVGTETARDELPTVESSGRKEEVEDVLTEALRLAASIIEELEVQ